MRRVAATDSSMSRNIPSVDRDTFSISSAPDFAESGVRPAVPEPEPPTRDLRASGTRLIQRKRDPVALAVAVMVLLVTIVLSLVTWLTGWPMN